MDKFSTRQFSKTISNANGTHDNYQRIPGSLSLQWRVWIPLVSERLEARANRINNHKCFVWAVVSWIKLNLYRKNRKRIEWNLTYDSMQRAKIEKSNILLYVQPHPQGILLSWYWKTKSFPQSDTRKVKCLRDKNAVYMNTQYMYIRTQIYNLCDLFMLALQHHLRLVTVQWCSFLFPNNLYWRNWSGKKQVNANRKKKNLGRKRRSWKSSW